MDVFTLIVVLGLLIVMVMASFHAGFLKGKEGDE